MALKLIIDGSRVRGEHSDFPVCVDLTHDALKTLAKVGFADADGSPLSSEIVSHDRVGGTLQASVRVPSLSNDTDTVIQIVEGESGGEVWPQRDAPVAADVITVEAWVDARDGRAEKWQSLVARWQVNEEWGAFDGYDATTTDGMETTGFFGCVFDGRYIYFSPQYDSQTRHGRALRYDTHGDFKDPGNWAAYDAEGTGGLVCKGYYGAVYDGRYVLFVPRRDPEGFHCRALRYDTHGDFRDAGSWEAFDVGADNSSQSAAFDGRYIYMNPGQRAETRDPNADDDDSPKVTGMSADQVLLASGNVIRFDTQGKLDDPASWTCRDVADTDGLDSRDFDGSCFDGRYIYLAPLAYAVALRYDTHADFNEPGAGGWQAYDCDTRFGMKRNVGAIFDGRYIYYVPYGECPVAVRFDTECDFHDDDAWQAYELAKTKDITLGYDGAFFDGRYIYYIPYWDEGDILHGVMLRYDITRDFGDPASWDTYDATMTDGLFTGGFNGGATDGRYLYCAAWMKEQRFTGKIGGGGNMLRYDTTGDNATFDLRYCDLGHNGGLCAAVPGPRFYINTDKGPRSIAADTAPPAPGRHHLVGVYDGEQISLYIDGEQVNRQAANGQLVANDVEVTIGRRFDGDVLDARVSGVARDGDWIATRYNNLADPAAFCRPAE